jgi:hypothetical protein
MIELSTAYNPGSLDAGQSYTHCDVTNINFDTLQKRIHLSYQYGTLSGDELAPGKARPVAMAIADEAGGTDYADLRAIMGTGATEGCVDGFRRALCQWLLDKGYEIGTIV